MHILRADGGDPFVNFLPGLLTFGTEERIEGFHQGGIGGGGLAQRGDLGFDE